MPEPEDDGFGALMGKVERERGFACANYKQKCLRRRVGLRLRARGMESFAEYSSLLDRDAGEFDRLVNSLTINVTRFFRNAAIWDSIAREVVAPLWDSEREEIRVWSAGCATGEEPYSMAMLFHRCAAVRGMLAQIARVRVLGTDLDAGALASAQGAAYTEQDLEETPSELRARYFTDRAPYTPSAGVRAMVSFARHDLLGADYPPVQQDVIICRNVLIYFDRPSQERVITEFHRSLAVGGYLILGKVETLLGASRSRFVPIAQRDRVFRKVS